MSTLSLSLVDTLAALAAGKPQTLRRVYERMLDGCRDAVVLEFTSARLLIQVNVEDDSILLELLDVALSLNDTHTAIDDDEPWLGLMGKTLGWGWVTTNQQGYCDGVMLSFDGLSPCLLFNVIASSIKIYSIVPAVPAPRSVSPQPCVAKT